MLKSILMGFAATFVVVAQSADAAVILKTQSLNSLLSEKADVDPTSHSSTIRLSSSSKLPPPVFNTKLGSLNSVTIFFDFSKLVSLSVTRTGSLAEASAIFFNSNSSLFAYNYFGEDFYLQLSGGLFRELSLPAYATSIKYDIPVNYADKATLTPEQYQQFLNAGSFGAPIVADAVVRSGTEVFINDGRSKATFSTKGVGTLSYLFDYTLAAAGMGNGASARGAGGGFQIEAIPSVPEPATWAMMLIGFGAVGGTMRCRKSKVTTRVASA